MRPDIAQDSRFDSWISYFSGRFQECFYTSRSAWQANATKNSHVASSRVTLERRAGPHAGGVVLRWIIVSAGQASQMAAATRM
jgi:hypothetical protein